MNEHEELKKRAKHLQDELKEKKKDLKHIKKKLNAHKKEEIKQNIPSTINYVFQSTLVLYLILLLIDQVWKNLLDNYIKLDYLLVIVIIFGVASVFTKQEERAKEPITWKDYSLITVLAIAGFIILKIKTGDLGWLSWLISGVASALIALLSLLVLDEEEEQEEKQFELTKNNAPKVIGIVLASLFALTIILTFFNLSFAESLRIVFGSIYILFLPGLVLTFVFFPNQVEHKGINWTDEHKDSKSIDWLERLALSFALSIAVVPLLVFYANLIGIKISTLSVSIITLIIIIISSSLAYRRIKGLKPFKA